jgi:hypothetical protein
MKNRILSLLSEVNRSGIDNLIKFINDSDYLTTAQCGTHHQCPEGLMMHSLEVCDSMMGNNLAGIPRESIILVALCHDLGIASLAGEPGGREGHPQRSLDILDRCGVELTDQERDAILNHHPDGIESWMSSAFASPLSILLQIGDGISSGEVEKMS